MKIRLLACLVLFVTSTLFAQQPAQQPAPPSASNGQPTVQERLGYPANSRLLIIHADDLGMSHSVNRATFEALENGWVTSSSILVPCPWFPEVAKWAKAHPEADLGIHLAMNSEWTTFRWGPVSGRDAVPTLLDADGYLPLLETEVTHRADPAQAEVELRAQIEKARDSGIHISHLDTHMTTLTQSPVLFSLYQKLGNAYRLPVLLERQSGTYRVPGDQPPAQALVDKVVSIDVGVPYKHDAWLDAYKKMLKPLPPGVYELIVHTAYDDPEMQGATADHPNWGATWRQMDFDTLKSKEFRDFLKDEKFVLVRWRDLARALPSATTATPPSGH